MPDALSVVSFDAPPRRTQTTPADILGFDPSYARLGDIVIVDEDDSDRAHAIADAVVESDIPVEAVLNRASKIKGEQRVREWDVIAGTPRRRSTASTATPSRWTWRRCTSRRGWRPNATASSSRSPPASTSSTCSPASARTRCRWRRRARGRLRRRQRDRHRLPPSERRAQRRRGPRHGGCRRRARGRRRVHRLGGPHRDEPATHCRRVPRRRRWRWPATSARCISTTSNTRTAGSTPGGRDPRGSPAGVRRNCGDPPHGAVVRPTSSTWCLTCRCRGGDSQALFLGCGYQRVRRVVVTRRCVAARRCSSAVERFLRKE